LFFFRHLTGQETYDVTRGRDDVFGHVGRGVQGAANVGIDMATAVEVQVQRYALAMVDLQVVWSGPQSPQQAVGILRKQAQTRLGNVSERLPVLERNDLEVPTEFAER